MSFTKNVGSTDKTIRIIAGIALIALAFTMLGGFASIGGIVAAVVGAVLILTAIINFCPLYRILGMRTNKMSN